MSLLSKPASMMLPPLGSSTVEVARRTTKLGIEISGPSATALVGVGALTSVAILRLIRPLSIDSHFVSP